MPTTPLAIYSTWGLHDELGDRVQLSAALAERALDGVLRWRDRFGLKTDIFHLDAFWFDPARGFQHFHPQLWPQGPDRLFARLRQEGLRLGLWYSTNGGRLTVPAWAPSRTTGDNYSLVDGPFFEHLRADLLHNARTWDVALYKFDFVDFGANAAGVTRPRAETTRLATERFVGLCQDIRAASSSRPHIIVHCGFARQSAEGVTETDATRPHVADASLLEGVDGYFSGDPQPSDLPTTRLSRAADLYQDLEVRRMLATGFPLRRIEDHGLMCADTNTANNRKNSGLRHTHLGTLARGGRRDLFYGDPDLADADDVAFMVRARSLFVDAWNRDLETAPLGSLPGHGPWHGWLTGGARRGLLWLVNPHLEAITVRLPIVDLAAARCLFSDGAVPAVQVRPDGLLLQLRPEQAVLLGLGQYADAANDLGHDPTGLHLERSEPLALTWRPTVDGFTANVDQNLPEGSELLVYARIRSADASAFGPGIPQRVGAGMERQREGKVVGSILHTMVAITVQQDGQPSEPLHQLPNSPIWSGMSWVLRRFPAAKAGSIINVTVAADLGLLIHVEALTVWPEKP